MHTALRLLVLSAVVSSVAIASEPCLSWRTFPYTQPELDGEVAALLVHDDGSGPALYVGGRVKDSESDTPFVERGVRRWDGSTFSDLGPGAGGTVSALVEFDDGTGPALYAAVEPSRRVRRWDGSAWSDVGGAMNNRIYVLGVHDDGSGPTLYAGGDFTQVAGQPAPGIARWDGASWVALGTGPGNGSEQARVFALATYDDGSGPALYVGGIFAGAAANASPNLARWSNGAWSGVDGGTNGYVAELVPWDDGAGPALFVVGTFSAPGLHVVARRGTAWSPVGGGLAHVPGWAGVVEDGNGPALYVCGASAQFAATISYWDGATWTDLAVPAPASCTSFSLGLNVLANYDEGAGMRLFAGTATGGLGDVRATLSRKDGPEWERVGPPLQGLNGPLRALAVHDEGSGAALYAAGQFCQAGDVQADNVARWTATGWEPLVAAPGSPRISNLSALASYDSAGTRRLVAAGFSGEFNNFGARLFAWDGVTWTQTHPSGSTNDSFFALQQFGSEVFVGGTFTYVGGLQAWSPHIARWNPSTGFAAVGAGPTVGANGAVNAFAVWDDGTGAALYAGGAFTVVNGVAAQHVARFDGATWTPIGGGILGLVDALVAFDDGTGPALYAAGVFAHAGGVAAENVARWNGTNWSALGAGLNAQVLSLGVFDDGSGPALYAGGSFAASGAAPMTGVARWDGTRWSAIGGGIQGAVWALRAHDDGSENGPQLFAAGDFSTAGTLASENFAAWRACEGAITKFCFGDGTSGPCPCGNGGLPGRGCDNSSGSGGARLNATGTTFPDTLVLHAAGEMPNASTLFFQGTTALVAPLAFGDGLRCAGGSLKRIQTTQAVNGITTYPLVGQDSISARSAAQGDPLSPGDVRTYQTWYRDPNLAFCAPPSGDAWNLSNAVRIVW